MSEKAIEGKKTPQAETKAGRGREGKSEVSPYCPSGKKERKGNKYDPIDKPGRSGQTTRRMRNEKENKYSKCRV